MKDNGYFNIYTTPLKKKSDEIKDDYKLGNSDNILLDS